MRRSPSLRSATAPGLKRGAPQPRSSRARAAAAPAPPPADGTPPPAARPPPARSRRPPPRPPATRPPRRRSAFSAELAALDGAPTPGALALRAEVHDGGWHWTADAAGVQGLTRLSIVDGKPAPGRRAEEAVELLVLSNPLTGVGALSGDFGDADISPAVAADASELAGHVCMGHIWVLAETAAGPLAAPLALPGTDAAACEAAVGGEHADHEAAEISGAAVVAAPAVASGAAMMRGAAAAAALLLAL